MTATKTVTSKSMARQCVQCKKGSFKVVSRSHSNIATIRRQRVNLQNRWVDGVQSLMCTGCLKTLKKNRPSAFVPAKKTATAKKAPSKTAKK